MPKKKNIPLIVLDFIRTYWIILGLVLTTIVTFATLPQRLTAAERKVEKVDVKTEQIQKWIERYEITQELIKKAPEGFVWDEKTEEFVPDPNYEPPKKRKK